VILNKGDGTLTFSNPTFNSTVGVNGTGTGHDRTLTLGGTNTGANTIEGAIQDNNAAIGSRVLLTKTGAGTWILEGDNTYTGPTAINGGTLIITGASQATSAITFDGGNLGLDVGSSVTAANATIDFTGQQVLVTGNPTLSSYTLLTANSLIGEPTLASPISGYELDVDGNQLKLVATGSDPYATWSGGAAFDDDENGDGVSNGLAFLLGALDPDQNALGLLPTVTENAGGLVLEFSMLDAAARGTATLFIEHSSDLGITDAWEEAEVPATSITVDDVEFVISGSGPLDVEATIPSSKAQGGKLFGRLKAVKP